MKNTLRKLLGMLLAAAMLLGCASTALAWEPESPHDEDLSDYKMCENFGDITLRVAVIDKPSIEDWETNDFILWLEEVTNIDFVFELIPTESSAEKLGLMLNSGDYPDMFWSTGMTDAMVSRFGVDEGMFLPLNDLIEEHGNFFKKYVMDAYPATEGIMTQLDGNIYSLPDVNECYHCKYSNKFWINQAWLDNLGLEMPTTLDELYNVLVAFRDQDANGNGDPTDEIPMAGDYVNGWQCRIDRPIINCFTYYPLDLTKGSDQSAVAFGMYLDDGKIVTPFEKAEFKEGVAYVAKLVKEGLIYEGSFTQDNTGVTNIAESGRLGAVPSGWLWFASIGGDIYRQYVPVMPLKGPDGYQNLVSFPYDAVTGNAGVISADTKYPVECFRVLDLFYSFAATIRSNAGNYGEQWTYNEGDVGINGEPAWYTYLTVWDDTKPQNYCVLQAVPSTRFSDYRLGQGMDPNVDRYSGDGLEQLLYEVSQEIAPYADDSKVVPPLKFTDAENSEMAIIKANLSNTIKEGMFAFFTGSRNMDADFDAWLADLNAQGLPKLIEMYQAAYDAQYK